MTLEIKQKWSYFCGRLRPEWKTVILFFAQYFQLTATYPVGFWILVAIAKRKQKITAIQLQAHSASLDLQPQT